MLSEMSTKIVSQSEQPSTVTFFYLSVIGTGLHGRGLLAL